MAKVVHFEIPADDLDRAKRFSEGNVMGLWETVSAPEADA
jgi:predicted enzyme related to lactoylglutathione lyase